MRTYCFTCQADTLVNAHGTCGFCDAKIASARGRRSGYQLGGHSYLGTEEFYAATYQRYLELRSIRRVANEVWREHGYASLGSCANTLHEAWRARGWATYTRGHANLRHGRARRGQLDPVHRHALRRQRGEIRGVQCHGVRLQPPAVGRRCKLAARSGSEFCRFHDPALREQVVAVAARARAALHTDD